MAWRVPNFGSVIAIVGALFSAAIAQPPGNGPGFALLDQPSPANFAIGSWLKWVFPPVPSNNPNPIAPGGTRYGAVGPFSLKYKIDAQFMANQNAATRAGAGAAVQAAFKTWSEATNGYMKFVEAPWGAVVNLDATFHAFFPGPPLDEWCANYCPGCAPCGPIWPGWGGDIDVFSRPTGFTLTSNGFTYNMTSGILGFTAIHRSADGIWSTEIYLNENFTWTTDPSAARTDPGGVAYGCHASGARALQPVGDERELKPGSGVGAVTTAQVFDIQTVVLHEIGHALGFDHPNEACSRGGIILDPYTRQLLPCGNFSSSAVMHGAYNGVRRVLTDPESGALAFLYRPRKVGDVDADDALTVSDAVSAMSLFENPSAATPYQVSALDFLNRNGRIDVEEISLLLFWVLDPINFSPGMVAETPRFNSDRAVTTITLSGTPAPPDVGLSNIFSLTLNLSNPDQIAMSGWDIILSYNPAVFSNPRLTTGTLLPAGSWSSIGTTPGQVRLAKLGFPPGDQSASGTIGTITFDVNLTAAGIGPTIISFPLLQTNLAVVNPANQTVRLYGSGTGDTFVISTPSAMSYNYDANADNTVNVEDMYTFVFSPIDVNKNSLIDAQDSQHLANGVRFWELPRIVVSTP